MKVPKTWADFHIDLPGGAHGEIDVLCPECSPKRKKSHIRCLSVNVEEGVFHCAHCGFHGSLEQGIGAERYERPRVPTKPRYAVPETPPDILLTWMAERCIPEPIVRRHGIDMDDAYMPGIGVDEKVRTVQFPVRQRGEIVNVKLRTMPPHEKTFRQVAGAKKIVYGWDDLTEANCYVTQRITSPGDGFRIYIVEGEMDKLSCEVAGMLNVVSVPDGAPNPDTKHMARKFDWLAEGWPLTESVEFVLAVDRDKNGAFLEEELWRRLGLERCLHVLWPSDCAEVHPPRPPCKDANDVLIYHGVEVLRAALAAPVPYPIEGVFEVNQLKDAIMQFYRFGTKKGLSTGWKNLDTIYTIEAGQLNVVTGIPSHGKSEVLDDLMVNLMRLHGWRFAVCSPENYPPERYLGKLLAKAKDKPFVEGFETRMTEPEVEAGTAWLHEHLHLILPEDTITVPKLLETLTHLVHRFGIRGAILDPWNEFDHSRPAHLNEAEYISFTLGAIRRWARKAGCAIWLVAHPHKMREYDGQNEEPPIPSAYSISGGAHWYNKSDNILCPWRDVREAYSSTHIYVQKVKVRTLGRPGMVLLDWEKSTGRYKEVYSPVGGVF